MGDTISGLDTVIIGAGPAGMTAAIYAKRKGLNIAVIADSVGGQMSRTGEIENYPGFDVVRGADLARKMRELYGIPYLEESFYGMTDTAKALRDMARELDEANGGPPVMQERVEALVQEEEAGCRTRLAPYRARLEGKRAVTRNWEGPVP